MRIILAIAFLLPLHAQTIGIDSHIDTIQRVLIDNEDLGQRSTRGHADLPRLRAWNPLDAADALDLLGTLVSKSLVVYDEAASRAATYLKYKEIAVAVDLGAGSSSSTVWTCDLSAEYVRINADYRT